MARPRRTNAARVLSALVLLPCLAGPARGQDDWTHVTEEDGVEVSQRPVPGRSLPVLRGIGVVEASLQRPRRYATQVVNVIVDETRNDGPAT